MHNCNGHGFIYDGSVVENIHQSYGYDLIDCLCHRYNHMVLQVLALPQCSAITSIDIQNLLRMVLVFAFSYLEIRVGFCKVNSSRDLEIRLWNTKVQLTNPFHRFDKSFLIPLDYLSVHSDFKEIVINFRFRHIDGVLCLDYVRFGEFLYRIYISKRLKVRISQTLVSPPHTLTLTCQLSTRTA